jgi:hypothetical protein
VRKPHGVALRKAIETARPTSAQRDRAVRLLAHEARGDASSDALAAAAERVCLRLSHHSGKVLGVDTFHALLARALAFVKPDFPFLGTVTVESSQPCLKGLQESLREQTAGQASEAIVAVVATFLALVAALIGEEMSLSVLVEIWAERSLADM